MYSLNKPVSELRTKIRQEFERQRYVSQLPAVDMLLFQSHSEYQVCIFRYFLAVVVFNHIIQHEGVSYASEGFTPWWWLTHIHLGNAQLLEAIAPCP